MTKGKKGKKKYKLKTHESTTKRFPETGSGKIMHEWKKKSPAAPEIKTR